VDGIEAQFRGDSDLGRQIGLSRATSDLSWMVPNVLGLLVEISPEPSSEEEGLESPD
jgi:hypothetical protein